MGIENEESVIYSRATIFPGLRTERDPLRTERDPVPPIGFYRQWRTNTDGLSSTR